MSMQIGIVLAAEFIGIHQPIILALYPHLLFQSPHETLDTGVKFLHLVARWHNPQIDRREINFCDDITRPTNHAIDHRTQSPEMLAEQFPKQFRPTVRTITIPTCKSAEIPLPAIRVGTFQSDAHHSTHRLPHRLSLKSATVHELSLLQQHRRLSRFSSPIKRHPLLAIRWTRWRQQPSNYSAIRKLDVRLILNRKVDTACPPRLSSSRHHRRSQAQRPSSSSSCPSTDS